MRKTSAMFSLFALDAIACAMRLYQLRPLRKTKQKDAFPEGSPSLTGDRRDNTALTVSNGYRSMPGDMSDDIALNVPGCIGSGISVLPWAAIN